MKGSRLVIRACAALFFVSFSLGIAGPVDAATFVRSATGTKLSTAGTPTSVSATLSAGAAAGDLLVAVVGANGSATITGPTGWSAAINQSGSASQGIFYVIASGGETAVAATVNANPGAIGIHVYEYSGATTFMTFGSSSGTGTTLASGSVTTTAANELVLAAFVSHMTGSITDLTWSDTDGFAERADFQTSSGGTSRDSTYAGGDKLTNTAGTHSVTVTASGSGDWRGQIVRFQGDTTAPTVTNATSSLADGTYGVGQVVPVQVTFSEPVTVVTTGGTPTLALSTGSPATTAVNYVSGSGTATLTFNYTVASGNGSADLDYASTGALALNGGTIKDAAGNNATLTLAAPGAAGSLGANKAILIDGVSPAVTNVTSSTANGSYGLGQTVSIQVVFNDTVTVTGTPRLTLATGSPATTAVDYVSGPPDTTLTFTYVVASGNSSVDLDYASTGALALNGGTIKDATGNNATLTLAVPGAAGSLGANKAIAVDASAPTVTVSSVASDPTRTSPIPFVATFNEVVTGLLSTEIIVTNGSVTGFTPVSGTVYAFDVTPSGQGAVTAQVPGSAAQDTAGNGNAVSNVLSRTYDSVGPGVTITTTMTSPTETGDILFTATFSEPVSGFTSFTQVTASNATVGDFVPVSSTVYTFDIYPIGDPDAPVTVTVSIGAGEAQDAAGNGNTVSNGGTPYSFVFDAHTPTVAVMSSASLVTSASPIPFTATFSEPVTGLLSTEIVVTNGVLGDFVPVSATVYTFIVTPSGQGAVSATVSAGVAQDTFGHLNLVSNTLIRTYDTVGATIVVTSTASNPTRISPIPFTATFNEAVSGLLVTEISVTNGVVGGFVPVSDTVYTFTVTPSGQGAVSASVPAGVAQDVVGNLNDASAALSRTYDTADPTLAEVTTVSTPTKDVTPDYAFSTTEAGAISYAGSCTSMTTVASAGSNAITFSTVSEGLHNDCAVAVTDAAGNVSSWLVASAFYVDISAPSAVVDLAASVPTSSGMTLSWTAPSDVGPTGRAASYDIRRSTALIVGDAGFAAATPVAGEPIPAVAGTSETMIVSGLLPETTYYFAIKASDDATNVSVLSNVPSATTTAAPAGGSGHPAEAGGSSTDLVLTVKASPSVVPLVGDKVTFTYTLTNHGPNHITNISVEDVTGDHACMPVVYAGGDTDLDGLLDTESRETWTFTCASTADKSHSHTAVAYGIWNYGRGSSNVVSTTILVGSPTGSANVHFHAKAYPSVLHAGGGTATIELEVGNLGATAITDIAFTGGDCVVSSLLEGDEDRDGKLDPGEDWSYVCTGEYASARTLAITFSGQAGDVRIADTALVPIQVGSELPHAGIHLHVAASPAALPVGGGTVHLTYFVSNNGNVPLREVSLASGSATCEVPVYESGDVGNDGILGIGERWMYTCVELLRHSEADAAMVSAHSDAGRVYDDALFVIPVATEAPIETDPTAEGVYDPTLALASTPDIDTDLGLEVAGEVGGCTIGASYKLPSDNNPETQTDTTVYHCGRDGKWHTFLNSKIFLSWYPNFTVVRIMDAATLAGMPQGEPVLYRPGARLIKLPSDDRTYAVSRGGLLRWVENEADAESLYGRNWMAVIDDLPETFFGAYRIGSPVER